MSLDITAKLARAGFTLDVKLTAPLGVTALFGPSGAGKTTIARIVAGLERGAQADVRLNGTPLTGLAAHQRNVGYVFQDARLFPHLTVRDNLLFGAPKGTDPAPMAARLGLSALLTRAPAGLSGGEAARVALGRALLRQPRLLILDEPLAGLDARRKAELLPYFTQLRQEGIPILYISHAIEEVVQIADTLVLLRAGQVQRVGPIEALLGDPSSAAMVGPGAAGAVLTGRCAERSDGLMKVVTPVGDLWLPDQGHEDGETFRLRLPASDVIVATEKPSGLSALNVFPAKIEAIHQGAGPAVMLGLQIRGACILARVTRRSMGALNLNVGRDVWAVVKATGVAPSDVGRG